MSVRAKKRKLRSSRWYGRPDKDGFIHRSWMKNQGLPDEAFDGRRVIGICNAWSELTPCNAHLRDLASHVKSGVWEAGGVPLEFPVVSLGETQMRPTAMLFRNLVAMDVEESIRANPIGGVVLLGGCDKTAPAQIMGACSVGIPFIVVSSGPMLTVSGGASGDGLDRVECCNSQVIRSADNPLQADGGISVLRGNPAPGGAILKTAAASRHPLNHRGRAVVFEDIEDLHQRIDRDDLEVAAESVLVLKGSGPCGCPGMPEVGNMPLPAKLARQGLRDMVRISDARMSGTAFGTVVLHVVPESAVGGPLALVESGDMIQLDVPKGRLTMEADASEMERRRRRTRPKHRRCERGYYHLCQNHVLQADQGADFDFLVGGSGSDINRESH